MSSIYANSPYENSCCAWITLDGIGETLLQVLLEWSVFNDGHNKFLIESQITFEILIVNSLQSESVSRERVTFMFNVICDVSP